MKNETATITVRVPVLEKQAFEHLCERLDITASQIIRRCIRETLEAAQSNYPDLLGDTPTPTKKKGR
jgi:predicted DNA-binding protein